MKIQESLIHHDIPVYREYASRWFQLYLFISALISNIIFGFALSPIAKELSTIYHVNDKFIQVLIVSFTVFSALMIIPGNILSEKYGIRSNIVLGCVLTLIGAFISMFTKYSFWFLYVGELISLFGFPFRLISTSKFTAAWFFPQNRILVTVFIALVFNASSGLAIRVPLWIIGDYDTKTDDVNFTRGKELIEDLVIFLAFLMGALTIPPIIFFRSQPPSPPSYTASDECPRENYIDAGRALVSNRDYLLLSLAFPFILGSVLLLTVQMEYIVKPFGFQLSDISDTVLMGMVAGLVGDLSVGYVLKKTLQYKMVLRVCSALSTIFFGLLIISLLSEVKILFQICYFIVCGTSSIMAVTFEFGCEISFPVSENSTIAFLGLVGNLTNFLQTIPEILVLQVNHTTIDQFDNKFSSTVCLLIMLAFITTGNLLTYLIQENLKRLQEDDKIGIQEQDDSQIENSMKTI